MFAVQFQNEPLVNWINVLNQSDIHIKILRHTISEWFSQSKLWIGDTEQTYKSGQLLELDKGELYQVIKALSKQYNSLTIHTITSKLGGI